MSKLIKERTNMFDIKTVKKAIEYLKEAGGFINEVEDEIYDKKIDDKTTGKLETAYIEIDQVIGFLQTLDKEKNEITYKRQ